METLARMVRELEEANESLDPQRCSRPEAERLLRFYSRIERLAAYGKAAVSARLDNPTVLARVSGTSVGAARRTIETARRIAAEPLVAEAARRAEVSLDQADEITRTTTVVPGAAGDLLQLARSESFHVLKAKARTMRSEAGDRATLHRRQHEARRLRHWVGEMGMVHIDAALEPHIGAGIVGRLETEARRIARDAEDPEPFERHLADALPAITGGDTPGGRAEVVVLVSHEVTQRGWRDVRPGEHCKIPGIGPVAPEAARRITEDAFLNGVFYDGKDLRHFKRWTRHIPVEVRTALRLGDPPGFDGPVCVDCGNRYHLQWDHIEPHSAGGPTSLPNHAGRCLPCHILKTAADRRAGKTHSPRAAPVAQPP